MGLVVVVPGHPLAQVEVLAFDGIGRMEEHVEAPVLETIVELLDLPVVLGMVGFVLDVGDSGKSAGCREPRSPFPSAVRANSTDDERRMGDDMMKKGNGTLLIAVYKELRDSEP